MIPAKKIIHVDMDCFYVAVEMRNKGLDPNKPYAVGGDPRSRGVLSTANYKAREFGVRSAISSAYAVKLCPSLTILNHHFSDYQAESHKIHQIFKDYTNIIQPLSLDEAFLDVSDCTKHQGSATLIASEIRKRIQDELQLNASAGIAPNKFLSKIASDWNKPNGQHTICPSDIESFMLKLPVKLIPGVGKVTNRKMERLGIITCLDLQQFTVAQLVSHFGKWGPTLYNLSRGIDSRPVKVERIRKSLSVEHTFAQDLASETDVISNITPVFDELTTRLDTKSITKTDIKSAYVKLTFSNFQKTTKETVVEMDLKEDFFQNLAHLAYIRQNRPVRLIGLGVRLDNTSNQTNNQQTLFA